MEKNYRVKARVETIATTTRLTDEKYGGWMAVNTGSAACEVMGISLLPTEGISFLDAVPAGSYWTQPIDIVVNPGGQIRLVRMIYEEIKD